MKSTKKPKLTTKSTTKPKAKSTTLFFTTTVVTTTAVTAKPSKSTTTKSSSCSCQIKRVGRGDVCYPGSYKWKDEATRAKYLRVATLADVQATKNAWCKTVGKWELGGADGVKWFGPGYKCEIQSHSLAITSSDQGCPGNWASILMCLACSGG